MTACTFYGSYYDPSPWTEQACVVEYAVPAGCPIHFVTGANPKPSDVTVTDGSGSAVANTAMLIDTEVVQLDTIDVYTCDCAHVTQPTDFQRFAVTAPSLVAGDSATVAWLGASGPTMSVAITDAAACPTAIDWPTSIMTAIACDRCPMDPVGSDMAGSGSGSGQEPWPFPTRGGGCATGGGASLGVALALLAVRRRRQR